MCARWSVPWLAWLCAVLAGGAAAGDWPQHQHDARRSGFTPEEIPPPYKIAWKHGFLPERPARRTQAIVSHGRVFVGTQQGVMHCFDAETGKELWKHEGAGSIQHSAGCEGGKVFFGSLDGCVYALDAATGELAWKMQTDAPFTVAPLLAEGKVFLGNHRGTFFALDQKTGKEAWRHKIDAPILNTAACDPSTGSGQAGRVLFGGEDIRVYALDAQSGKRLWVSDQLQGMSLKDTHPVVHKGHVIVRPMTHFQADIYSGLSEYRKQYKTSSLPGGWQAGWKGWPPQGDFAKMYEDAAEERAGKMPEKLIERQKAVIEHMKAHPEDQDMFVLDARTGQTALIPPHLRVNAMHGPVTPPVEDLDGYLIVPWVHCNHGWARYDITKNLLAELIIPPTQTNSDENMNVSCGGRHVYVFHCEEGNANYTGIYDLRARTWLQNPAPGVPWFDNLQSGSNPVSIAHGRYFHILFNTLVVRTAAEGGK